MKLTRKVFKDLKTALKELEPKVKQLDPLLNGRDMKNFPVRPREAWANWLLCAVLTEVHGMDFTFGEDADTDGTLINTKTGEWRFTEHVSALDTPSKKPTPKGEERIIQAINKKIAKGAIYAENKILVVFFDGAGKWYRDKVREGIKKHNFYVIYGIGLVQSGKQGYTYTVTEFQKEFSVTHEIYINYSFTNWKVRRI